MRSGATSTDPAGGGEPSPPRRQLYGRRRGPRLRSTRQQALDQGLPGRAFALPDEGPLEPRTLFAGPVADAWLEIGFGGGEHLAFHARANPQVGMVGVEPFVNGVARLLVEAEAGRLDNLRILADDARLLLRVLVPGSLGRIFVLFPDPWPKLRHHKRRIVNPETLALMARALRPGGELRLATDDAAYAAFMERSLRQQPLLRPLPATPRPDDWPETRYERKALDAGRSAVLFRLQRGPEPAP
ncbi:MAG: tRNA (guanosine(46)-N7)-methyltransferase TrmB [Geminicoccaceae bacterium]